MNLKTAFTLLQSVPGGATQQRVDLLTLYQPSPGQTVPESATLAVVSDERTGHRFGQAKCRAGRCLKIGSGGRNKGQSHAYQIWAVWE